MNYQSGTIIGASALADARRVFDRQHDLSRREPPPSLELRRDRLARLRALISGHAEELAQAVSDDFGVRSRTETQLMEIAPSLGAVDLAIKQLPRWMAPERRRVAPNLQPAKAWVRWEPLGVIGIISPWNYPLQLAISPMVDAFAAGNRVMLKPSELTPRFAELLARLVAERFDEGEAAVVTGGVEVGEAFAGLPFDHLLFTGSTAVGRRVYQAAAANLTPVTLELGGKSPVIVCPDYPLAKAARSIAWGKWVNAGQTCIAPDFVLAPADRADALAEELIAQAKRSYPAIAGNPDYSSVISERHRRRLQEGIDEARRSGARILRHEDAGAEAEGKIGPTVVLHAPADGVLMREEIFGPVLPIVSYRTLDEAIAYVGERDRPLALYCFTNDRAAEERVLGRTLSGGVTLNGTLLHVADESLPFGGVGPSGIGAYHGREGFRRFSHARGVHKVGFVNALELLGPPWGRAAAAVGKMLVKG